MSKIENLTTSGTFLNTRPPQLINKVREATYPLFSLTNNQLDGSYRPMAQTLPESQEIGWWSKDFADSNGYFANPPTIEFTFVRQALLFVDIVGDLTTRNYVVDARVEIYASTTLVRTDTITGNTENTLRHTVNLDNVDRCKIYIDRISRPGDNARIIEVATYVEDEAIDDLMDAPTRQIYAKAEIHFLNPFQTYDVSVDSADASHFTFTPQLINGIIQPSQKWFSLTCNLLDGSYHPLEAPPNPKHEIGWWSEEISNDDGTFTKPPKVTLDMTEQIVLSVSVIGDITVPIYPVDFDIFLYDKEEKLVGQKNVVGNKDPISIQHIVALNVTKCILVFRKMNRGNTNLRLMEVGTTFKVAYDNNKLISLTTYEELTYESSGIPLGVVSANEVSLVIDNTDQFIDVWDPDSIYHVLLTRNRRVKVWYGVELYKDYIKWYPQGTFYTTADWVADIATNLVTCRALDLLELLRLTTFYCTQIYENYNLYQLFELVIKDYKLMPIKYHIDESLKNIILPYAWFDEISHREALRLLASIANVVVYVDRNEVLRIQAPNVTVDSTYTFKDSTSIINRKYPNRWKADINIVSAQVFKYQYGTEAIMSQLQEDIIMKAGQTITTMYKYSVIPSKQVRLDIDNTNVRSSFVYYAWGVEVTLTNPTNTIQTIKRLNVIGTPLDLKATQVVTKKVKTPTDDMGNVEAPTHVSYLLQDTNYAEELMDIMLHRIQESLMDVEMEARGHIALGLTTKVDIELPRTQTPVPYTLQRIATNWDGALDATILAHKI